MNTNSNDDLSAVYDNVPDALLIGMARRCFNQMQRRRLISAADTIEVIGILSEAIDNAIDANEALNKANAILRGDV
jgi:anti-sigma regulatory factor (Ser/Thr protein kinase)